MKKFLCCLAFIFFLTLGFTSNVFADQYLFEQVQQSIDQLSMNISIADLDSFISSIYESGLTDDEIGNLDMTRFLEIANYRNYYGTNLLFTAGSVSSYDSCINTNVANVLNTYDFNTSPYLFRYDSSNVRLDKLTRIDTNTTTTITALRTHYRINSNGVLVETFSDSLISFTPNLSPDTYLFVTPSIKLNNSTSIYDVYYHVESSYGGTVFSNGTENGYYFRNSTPTISAYPTVSGYQFVGWYTSDNVLYDSNAEITLVSAKSNLIAKFELIPVDPPVDPPVEKPLQPSFNNITVDFLNTYWQTDNSYSQFVFRDYFNLENKYNESYFYADSQIDTFYDPMDYWACPITPSFEIPCQRLGDISVKYYRDYKNLNISNPSAFTTYIYDFTSSGQVNASVFGGYYGGMSYAELVTNGYSLYKTSDFKAVTPSGSYSDNNPIYDYTSVRIYRKGTQFQHITDLDSFSYNHNFHKHFIFISPIMRVENGAVQLEGDISALLRNYYSSSAHFTFRADLSSNCSYGFYGVDVLEFYSNTSVAVFEVSEEIGISTLPKTYDYNSMSPIAYFNIRKLVNNKDTNLFNRFSNFLHQQFEWLGDLIWSKPVKLDGDINVGDINVTVDGSDQTIIENITNDYDIDVDVSLNNELQILTNNNIDLNLPEFSLPDDDLTGGITLINTVIDGLSDSGIGFVVGVPVVLIILGAIF